MIQTTVALPFFLRFAMGTGIGTPWYLYRSGITIAAFGVAKDWTSWSCLSCFCILGKAHEVAYYFFIHPTRNHMTQLSTTVQIGQRFTRISRKSYRQRFRNRWESRWLCKCLRMRIMLEILWRDDRIWNSNVHSKLTHFMVKPQIEYSGDINFWEWICCD